MLEFRLSALSSENYNIIAGGVAWATTECPSGRVDTDFGPASWPRLRRVPAYHIVGVHIRTAMLFLRDPLALPPKPPLPKMIDWAFRRSAHAARSNTDRSELGSVRAKLLPERD